MLKNYLVIALRNLRRYPAYSFINITGLAIGMACFVLILLFVQDERRYDRHHQHAGIVALLLMEFTKLVLLAFVIAVPVAYLAMDRWLSGFAYHVDISWWIFPVAGLMSLAIALLTISYQSIRAATADPVKALRIE